MVRMAPAFVAVAAVSFAVAAQAQKPAFEVASVKPQRELPAPFSPDLMPRVKPGGVFSPTYATVEDLLAFAYDLKPYRISGGPDWIRHDRFAINARAGGDVSADGMKLMVQSLLEDRFNLRTHVERRDMRFGALVLARPDGRPGPSLLPIDECSPAVVNELRRKFPEKYPGPVSGGVAGSSSPGVTQLADMLTIGLGTPVVDATGLTGCFYYSFRSQFSLARALLGARGPREDPSLPALSTALEDELGLKLESRRGPMDVLVIDSVQQPTED